MKNVIIAATFAMSLTSVVPAAAQGIEANPFAGAQSLAILSSLGTAGNISGAVVASAATAGVVADAVNASSSTN